MWCFWCVEVVRRMDVVEVGRGVLVAQLNPALIHVGQVFGITRD
jgi:hypothetical protein